MASAFRVPDKPMYIGIAREPREQIKTAKNKEEKGWSHRSITVLILPELVLLHPIESMVFKHSLVNCSHGGGAQVPELVLLRLSRRLIESVVFKHSLVSILFSILMTLDSKNSPDFNKIRVRVSIHSGDLKVAIRKCYSNIPAFLRSWKSIVSLHDKV